MQQHLPFTVLKLLAPAIDNFAAQRVATTPTVYGIETRKCGYRTVDAYGNVATTPTVYGIETLSSSLEELIAVASCNNTYRLRY